MPVDPSVYLWWSSWKLWKRAITELRYCDCVRVWKGGMAQGWIPLPTRPRWHCIPALLILLKTLDLLCNLEICTIYANQLECRILVFASCSAYIKVLEKKIAISGVQKTKNMAFNPLNLDFDEILTVAPDHIRTPKLDLQVQKWHIIYYLKFSHGPKDQRTKGPKGWVVMLSNFHI